jgi:hypothetical protein
MISFSPLHLFPNRTRNDIRVLRFMPASVLVATLSRDQTAISLFRDDLSSILVISFKANVDILNASLSENNELVHVTERLRSTAGQQLFYRSAIYDMRGILEPDDKFYAHPVDGIFVGKPGPACHLAIYTNREIVNYQVVRGKKEIIRQKPTVISNVIWMNFSGTYLAIITEAHRTFTYEVLDANAKCSWTLRSATKVNVHERALLPPELSLLPIEQARLPIFRYSRYRFYIFKIRQKLCFVQQLFESGRPLNFHVSLDETGYSKRIIVPNVAQDVPVCFLLVADVLVVFASNCFICLIDFNAKVPLILVLPKIFANSCCGLCAEAIPERELVIDLDSGEIYHVEISFRNSEVYSRFLDKNALLGFAALAQRMLDSDMLADLLRVLEVHNTAMSLVLFAQFFFSFLPQPAPPSRRRLPHIPDPFLEIIEDMELEFPSASRRSRAAFFRNQLAMQKITDKACTKVLRMLKDQNNTVMVIRTAIDQWAARYNPTRFRQALFKFVLHNEAMARDFPQVPGLKDEMQATDDAPISAVLRYRLRPTGLFQERPHNDVLEAEYWKKRIDEQAADALKIRMSFSQVDIPEVQPIESAKPRIALSRSMIVTAPEIGGIPPDLD